MRFFVLFLSVFVLLPDGITATQAECTPISGITRWLVTQPEENAGAGEMAVRLKKSGTPRESNHSWGFTGSVLWGGLVVSEPGEWVLVSKEVRTGMVRLFQEGPEGVTEIASAGYQAPMGNYYREPTLHFSGSGSYIIQVQSLTSPLTNYLELCPADIFAESVRKENVFYGWLVGFLLLIVLHNLFLALSLPNRMYAVYAWFALSMLYCCAIYMGINKAFLSDSWSFLFTNADTISICLVMASAMYFANLFFELKTSSPRWHALFKYLAPFWLVIGLFSLVAGEALVQTIRVWRPAALVFFLLVMVFFVVDVTRRGLSGSPFFLAAWAALLAGGIARPLSTLGLIESNMLTRDSVFIGASIEMLILSLGLAHRFRRIEQTSIMLKAANAAKSNFLARMSHELRTPLTTIIGAGEVLSNLNLKDDAKSPLRMLRRAGENLMSIINDILDMSKIEADAMVIERVPTNVNALAHNTYDILGDQARAKGLELVGFVDPGLPEEIYSDPTRVQQILINLVGNAIKFTSEGHVFLAISRSTEAGMLDFTVRDTGIGIPPTMLTKIFADFAQADSATTRKYGGTGLGLSISARLAKLMGGNLKVKSTLGQGSEFTLQLPLMVREGTVTPDLFLAGKQAVVFADRELHGYVLEEYIRFVGGEVQVYSGIGTDTGLQLPTEQPDILIVDSALVPDDLEFSVPENTIGLWLSAGTPDQTSWERAQAAGFHAIIEKPVRIDELYEKLKLTTPGVAGAQAGATGKSEATILLVEDNADNRQLFKALLGNQVAGIDIAGNGQEAVEKFKSKEYGLVFMDIHMPVMDGLEATKRIRKWEAAELGARRRQNKVPILALTAHSMTDEVQKIIEAGCDLHIPKPFRRQDILAGMEKFGL